MITLANVLLNEDFSIRTTQLNKTETYELSDLLFYVPNVFNCSHIFILLTDSMGMTDIIPLQFIGNHQSHKKYKVSYSNSIRVKSGIVTLQMLIFNSSTHQCNISIDNISLNASIKNYKATHQLAITMELNSFVKDLYDKIVKLTNVNIELYDKIMKEVNVNDN